MKKSPLYTATGDKGTTSLIGGVRESKASPRIEAYGTVDELNSHIGLVAATLPAPLPADPDIFVAVQCKLFDIGTALAYPPETEHPQPVSTADVQRLERAIDAVDAELPQLSSFILPGGCTAAATAQVARTVCRRAERRMVALGVHSPVDRLSLVYVNRLSDFLYAIARFNHIKSGIPEILWRKDC